MADFEVRVSGNDVQVTEEYDARAAEDSHEGREKATTASASVTEASPTASEETRKGLLRSSRTTSIGSSQSSAI